jgi:plastocyanin
MANGMMTTIRYEGVAPAVDGGHDHLAAPLVAGGAVTAVYVPAGAVTTPYKISMTDNRYAPTTLTVPVGSTVAFVNNGTNLHTVTPYDLSFESGTVPTGQAWTYTFTKPGTYQYFCRQHLLNGMTGLITVQ